MLHQGGQEVDIMARPLDQEGVERLHLQIGRLVAGLAPGNQLGNHRVVEHRHLAAFLDAVIDADIGFGGRAFDRLLIGDRLGRIVTDQPPNAGQEAAIRVFGIDAVLDRPTIDADIVLRHRQLFAIGDADHLLDQVDAGDRFGHRMLDLQAGVHFEEVETLARRVLARNDQFDRPRRVIIHGLGQRDALLAHGLAHLGRDEGRWRFLHNLLVAALDRAFALVQIEHVAVLVAEDLDLDMARVLDELLDEDAVVAEGVETFALGRLEAFANVLLVISETHALAAAARAGLHHHRIADLVGDAHSMFGIVDLADIAGDDIDACFLGQLLGLDLVAHCRDGIGRRADEGDVFLGQSLHEARALGQEAIARMHGLGPGLLGRRDDLIRDQVAFGSRRRADMHGLVGQLHEGRARIGVRIDRDGLDTHAARGADDTAGDFATVSDEDFLEHQMLASPF